MADGERDSQNVVTASGDGSSHGRSTASAPSQAQSPGRFTLRELFVLTALVCAFGASWSWFREPGLSVLLVPLSFAVASTYGIYMATRSRASVIAVLPIFLVMCFLMLPSLLPKGRVAPCSYNLKLIALALHNYHDVQGSFPPAHVPDKNGKPMHSWRVLLLPYLERRDLYDRYDFSEPWDGPNNSKLHGEIMRIYSCPSRPRAQPRTETSYVAVVGAQTAWPGKKAVKLDDLTDGTTNTLVVVEIANSGIHWMEPRDLDFSQMPMQVNPPKGQGISSNHTNVAYGAFADGHTQALSNNTPPKIIRALLTTQGGETIGDY